jgi:hypothetical protein
MCSDGIGNEPREGDHLTTFGFLWLIAALLGTLGFSYAGIRYWNLAARSPRSWAGR